MWGFKYLLCAHDLCAHDHCIVVEKLPVNTAELMTLSNSNKRMVQVISGGGGAPLSLTDKGIEEAQKLLSQNPGVALSGKVGEISMAMGGRGDGYTLEESAERKFKFKHGYVKLDLNAAQNKLKILTYDIQETASIVGRSINISVATKDAFDL